MQEETSFEGPTWYVDGEEGAVRRPVPGELCMMYELWQDIKGPGNIAKLYDHGLAIQHGGSLFLNN